MLLHCMGTMQTLSNSNVCCIVEQCSHVIIQQARTVSLKDDWVKVINRILVDSVDMDIPNRVSIVLVSCMCMLCNLRQHQD